MLLVSAWRCLIGKKILDPWRLVYKDNQDFDSLVEKWKQVLSFLIPFHGTLEPALVGGLKNRETSKNVALQFCAVVSSLGSVFIHNFKSSLKVLIRICRMITITMITNL